MAVALLKEDRWLDAGAMGALDEGAREKIMAHGHSNVVSLEYARRARALTEDPSVDTDAPPEGFVVAEDLRALAVPQPKIVWVGTTPNRSPGLRPRQRIVIHGMWGSTEGSIQWNKRADVAASAHFYIDRQTGVVHQLVSLEDGAWGTYYRGDWHGGEHIHIEHEDNQLMGKSGWVTSALWKSSVALTAWLCVLKGIPADRAHIVDHEEVNVHNGIRGGHWDVGPYFVMDRYVADVRAAIAARGGSPGGSPGLTPAPFDMGRIAFLSAHPDHKAIAVAAADAMDEFAGQGLASHSGDTPGEILYATGVSADAPFGQKVSALLGSHALKHVSPRVSVVGGPDKTDIVSTFKLHPKLPTAQATEYLLRHYSGEFGLPIDKVLASFRRRLPKGSPR